MQQNFLTLDRLRNCKNLIKFESILVSTQSTIPTGPDEQNAELNSVRKFLSVFQYSQLAMKIVWSTSAPLTLAMATSTLLSGVLPAVIASVGGMFVDAVSQAIQSIGDAADLARRQVLVYVLLEAGLVIIMTGAQRLNAVCQSILRVLLGNRINVMILEKALTLELAHFEDAEYYDKLVRARREASSRPLIVSTTHQASTTSQKRGAMFTGSRSAVSIRH